MAAMASWLIAYARRRNLLPQISATEREALEAGTVWADGELFSGRPDLGRLMREPWPQLQPARLVDLLAVLRQDLLVRGHDVLAGAQRRRDQRVGGLRAAHRLDDHVHVRARDEVRGRVGE